MQGNSFAYQAFQVFRHAAILFAAIILTWLDPQKTIINHFELLMLLGGSVTFFWVTGLLDSFLLIYKAANLEARGKIVFQALVLALFFAFCCAIAIVWIGLGMQNLPQSGNSLYYFAGFIALESASLLLAYLLLAENRSKTLLIYGIAAALAYFIALLLPIWSGNGLENALFLLLIVAVSKTLWLIVKTLRFPISIRLDSSVLKQFARIGGPLAAVALLSQSAIYVDGYLVNRFFPAEFAEFRYGARELPFVLILANSLSAVKSGEYAEAMQKFGIESVSKSLKSSSNRLIWALFPLSILMLLVSKPLFEVVLAGGFAAAVPVFDIYLLLIVPRMLFPQALIRGYHRTEILTASAFVELMLNVALSLIFLQWWGISGIAAATVVAFLVEKLILVTYLKVAKGQSWSSYTELTYWLPWTIVLFAAFAFKYGILASF